MSRPRRSATGLRRSTAHAQPGRSYACWVVSPRSSVTIPTSFSAWPIPSADYTSVRAPPSGGGNPPFPCHDQPPLRVARRLCRAGNFTCSDDLPATQARQAPSAARTRQRAGTCARPRSDIWCYVVARTRCFRDFSTGRQPDVQARPARAGRDRQLPCCGRDGAWLSI